MTLLTLVKLAHLVGLIMGFGAAAFADLTILREAVLKPVRQQTIDAARGLSHFVFMGLALLWASGIALVWLRASADPHFLMNQKLWAKVAIVCFLTINGLAVHKLALAELQSRIGLPLFDAARPAQMATLALIGAISSVSWAMPFALGAATELNFRVEAITLLGIWATLVIFAFGALLTIARLAAAERRPGAASATPQSAAG
jgi:hypothetical protein